MSDLFEIEGKFANAPAGLDQDEAIRELAREVAREEIASLAGLVMNRLQTVDGSFGLALRRIWGEALSDFSGHTRGEEPGA